MAANNRAALTAVAGGLHRPGVGLITLERQGFAPFSLDIKSAFGMYSHVCHDVLTTATDPYFRGAKSLLSHLLCFACFFPLAATNTLEGQALKSVLQSDEQSLIELEEQAPH